MEFTSWLITFEERPPNKLISVGACGQAAKLAVFMRYASWQEVTNDTSHRK
jgi:hypothetical protein